MIKQWKIGNDGCTYSSLVELASGRETKEVKYEGRDLDTQWGSCLANS